MEVRYLLETIGGLTGELIPGRGVPESDLQEARLALALTILAGKPGESLLPPLLKRKPPVRLEGIKPLPPEKLEEIDKFCTLAQEKFAAREPDSPLPLAFLRTLPKSTPFDPEIPDWARGMEISLSLGPFFYPDGHQVYVDLVIPVTLTKVVCLPDHKVLGVFPVSLLSLLNPGRHLVLGEGSVWLAASHLVPDAPGDAFVGFRIDCGSLDFDADISVVDGVVGVGPHWKGELSLHLNQPPVPPATSGPGLDASFSRLEYPDLVRLRLTPQGSAINELGDFNATVYGTTLALTKGSGAFSFDAVTNTVRLPFDATPDLFPVADYSSQIFSSDKSAAVTGTAWALPVAITSPDHLGQAANSGALALSLGAGIEARWHGLKQPVSFRSTRLYLLPGVLEVRGEFLGLRQVQTFKLWAEAVEFYPSPIPHYQIIKHSTIDLLYPQDAAVTFYAEEGYERLTSTGAATAHLSLPRQADGARLALRFLEADLFVWETPRGTEVFLWGIVPSEDQPEDMALALENALLVVQPTNSLALVGNVLHQDTVKQGTLYLRFSLRRLLPTLPDPYAASFFTFGQGDTIIGQVNSQCTWGRGGPLDVVPTLNLSLILYQGMSIVGATNKSHYDLLDVSTNADQLGVRLNENIGNTLSIDQHLLSAAGQNVRILTVPQISWEPMVCDPEAPEELRDELAHPTYQQPAGGIHVPTVNLVPISPDPLLRLYVREVGEGEPLVAGFNLPFGLIARVDTSDRQYPGLGFEINQPRFPAKLIGGLQVTMTPPPTDPPEKSAFPGWSRVTPGYGTKVLGETASGEGVADIFAGEFDTHDTQPVGRVPVHRFDFSGYGASVFSDWRDPDPTGACITKVQFKVLVGRTAYEVIQAQSILLPWGVRVVRTITLDRQAAGYVLRADTGWQAASAGEFRFPGFSDQDYAQVHQGAVNGVFNVRNIQTTGKGEYIPTPWKYQPVVFDADVRLFPEKNTIITGGFDDALVPCRNLTGYVQLEPTEAEVTFTQLYGLLAEAGPLRSLLACMVDVGKSGLKMKITGVEVGTGFGGVRAALAGAPILPRDGAWSMARITLGHTQYIPLDHQEAVLLVQKKPTDVWSFGDCFIQSTGTSKLLFPRPYVIQGQAALNVLEPPRLADVSALLSSIGLFPESALIFPEPQSLAISGEDFGLSRSWTIETIDGDPLKKTLLSLDGGSVKVILGYYDNRGAKTTATVNLNPQGDPRWEVRLNPISFEVFSPIGDSPLLTIVGALEADANTSPALTVQKVIYGGMLNTIMGVFDELQDLAKHLPSNGGASLAVGFSQTRLTIRNHYALPTIPLGIGEVTDVTLNLGFDLQLPSAVEFTAGIGSAAKPFRWLVTPLAGTGVLQVGVRNGDLDVLIQAGLGLGLGINLGIARGSASVVIALRVDTASDPFLLMVILSGQASVEVLGGVASASLVLSCGLGIQPGPPPDQMTLHGVAQVGIHISICWVIDIDFDGDWHFSQTVS
jgi:hypothetical protein